MDTLGKPNPLSEEFERFDALWKQINSPQVYERKRRFQENADDIQAEIKRLQQTRPDTAGNFDTSNLDQLYAQKVLLQEELRHDEVQLAVQNSQMNELSEKMKAAIDNVKATLGLPPNSQPLAQADLVQTPMHSSTDESFQSSHPFNTQAPESRQPDNEEETAREDSDDDSFTPEGGLFDDRSGFESDNTGNTPTSLTQGRSIEFDEAYREYPMVAFQDSERGLRSWYILQCEDCKCVFDLAQRALEHLLYKHKTGGEMSQLDAVRALGTAVINCDEGLAETNNRFYNRDRRHREVTVAARIPQGPADVNEEVPPPSQSALPTAATSGSRKRRRRGRPKSKSASWTPPRTFHGLDPRIKRLQKNDIVSVWNSKMKKFFPVMIIAWGECIRFNVDDSLAYWNLKPIIPNCYSRAESANAQSWATGYNDFEHLAHRRQVPGLYFRQQCDFPTDCQSGWVQLNMMKVFDPDCPHTLYKEAVVEAMEHWPIYYPNFNPIARKYTTENERMEERTWLEDCRRRETEAFERQEVGQESRSPEERQSV